MNTAECIKRKRQFKWLICNSLKCSDFQKEMQEGF